MDHSRCVNESINSVVHNGRTVIPPPCDDMSTCKQPRLLMDCTVRDGTTRRLIIEFPADASLPNNCGHSMDLRRCQSSGPSSSYITRYEQRTSSITTSNRQSIIRHHGTSLNLCHWGTSLISATHSLISSVYQSVLSVRHSLMLVHQSFRLVRHSLMSVHHSLIWGTSVTHVSSSLTHVGMSLIRANSSFTRVWFVSPSHQHATQCISTSVTHVSVSLTRVHTALFSVIYS